MAEAYYDIGTADDHLISRLRTREAVISHAEAGSTSARDRCSATGNHMKT
jgi:hypothetical protein